MLRQHPKLFPGPSDQWHKEVALYRASCNAVLDVWTLQLLHTGIRISSQEHANVHVEGWGSKLCLQGLPRHTDHHRRRRRLHLG